MINSFQNAYGILKMASWEAQV